MENRNEAKFSPRKTTTRRNCCVPQCSSVAFLNPELRFHTFPSEGEFVFIENKFNLRESCDRRKAWAHVLRIGKPISKNMFVCSRHFLKSDYILPDVPAKIRYLKRTAVPSLNLPRTFTDKMKERQIEDTPKRCRQRKAIDKKVLFCHSDEETEILNDNTPVYNEPLLVAQQEDGEDYGREIAAEALMSLASQTSLSQKRSVDTQCSVEKRDFGCQVCSGDLKTSFVDLIDTKKRLITFTGIDSFEKLVTLTLILSQLIPTSGRNILNVRSKVVMALMKIKLNWPFAVLATLFSVTPTTCKNIFCQFLKGMAPIMKTYIEWPTKEEILKNTPICFENFKRVRAVFDCTEIRISKFRCLKCRILSYSHYKGGHTVKYMIGVTPAGLISFLSAGYGGRASDKKIFEESGVINLLEAYTDDIMVDKGFLIKQICLDNCIGVIHPPFLRKNTTFTRGDALATSSIAKARVHVERVIERVKKFKILSETLPLTLLPLVDEIMVIACGLTNLANPVLADDKFIDCHRSTAP